MFVLHDQSLQKMNVQLNCPAYLTEAETKLQI